MPPFMPFKPYSIAVEKSACSTPCVVIRANRLVPIRSRPAKNGISIFTGFISPFLAIVMARPMPTDSDLESGDKSLNQKIYRLNRF